MSDELQYFQMQITIGIEATTRLQADILASKLVDAVAMPLYSNDTAHAKVFETFTSQAYEYPSED